MTDLTQRIDTALEHENPYNGHCSACETPKQVVDALLRECRDALAEKAAEIAALLAAVSTYEDGYRAGWDDASRGGPR